MKLQPPKGTRDFYPDEQALRRYLHDAWRAVSVRHGFDEVDGPIFESLDLYRVKSGDGIVSELFHFKFKDGSRLDKAFTYDWRFWTVPEITELLKEAGFSNSTVYWEETDEDGDETGEFVPATEGPADPSWIAYIVAQK